MTLIFLFIIAFLAVMPFVAVMMTITPVPRILPTGMLITVALDHPLFLYEIHRLSARVVSIAMLVPFLLMARWDIQIDRLAHHGNWLLNDDHGLLVHDDRRWTVADVNSSIDTGLVDTDRDPHGGLR